MIQLDKKIRLRLPVLSGIRLHPKTSDFFRLRNSVFYATCTKLASQKRLGIWLGIWS